LTSAGGGKCVYGIETLGDALEGFLFDVEKSGFVEFVFLLVVEEAPGGHIGWKKCSV
jgi:hypothetical protein